MDWLIIPGVVVTVIGLGLLAYTIIQISAAKREGLTGEEMKTKLQGAVALNLAAMGCSGIGLMMVTLGVLL